ncbi:SPW repeat protein [Streptomyces sp. XD-27]|uniref:SPW repeat protein n=1 Tax=Streptomyces sp. XD-27 TaxID=3062779 RepID=UPI0026F44634|nr:SPW repeat protein [Streptomyces sp. XD-27]WKX69944.1 SPW repeat protein [Streptomyces sp. XD-27]
MADVSHRSDITGHPDVSEMRERYARMTGGRDVVFLDGPVLLAGVYLAASPYVVGFAGTTDMRWHNLIVGLSVAVLGLGLTLAPQRMYGLSWTLIPIGLWLVISPWGILGSPTVGVIWSNIVAGAVTCVLGAAAATLALRSNRGTRAAAPWTETPRTTAT